MVSVPWGSLICITTEMNILVNSDKTPLALREIPFVGTDQPSEMGQEAQIYFINH